MSELDRDEEAEQANRMRPVGVWKHSEEVEAEEVDSEEVSFDMRERGRRFPS